MKAGSVIVDLSAEGGGNCDDTLPGQTTQVGLVTIVAPLNVPSLLAQDASELYSKNQYELLKLMLKANIIAVDWTDEVIERTALTHDGKLSKPPDKQAKPATKPIIATKPSVPAPTKAA
jgi:NAD(P) transhydrogenase subunit alpha